MTTQVKVMNVGPKTVEVHRVSADDETQCIKRIGDAIRLEAGEDHDFYVHSFQILMVGEKE
jgi:hypothetical protein